MKEQIQQHLQQGDVQSIASVGSAGSAWAAFLSDANEILVTIATIIAIVTGGWALLDKIRAKMRGKPDESPKSVQRRPGPRASNDPRGMG